MFGQATSLIPVVVALILVTGVQVVARPNMPPPSTPKSLLPAVIVFPREHDNMGHYDPTGEQKEVHVLVSGAGVSVTSFLYEISTLRPNPTISCCTCLTRLNPMRLAIPQHYGQSVQSYRKRSANYSAAVPYWRTHNPYPCHAGSVARVLCLGPQTNSTSIVPARALACIYWSHRRRRWRECACGVGYKRAPRSQRFDKIIRLRNN